MIHKRILFIVLNRIGSSVDQSTKSNIVEFDYNAPGKIHSP